MSRIVYYDATAGALSWLWAARVHGDEGVGIRSWEEMQADLRSRSVRSVERVEVRCHGYIAQPAIAKKPIPYDLLPSLAYSLAHGALWWWRTCAVFAGHPGQVFAERCARELGCRVAGHTFDIGRGRSPWRFWEWGAQSGLHVLSSGQQADWDPTEGLDAAGRPRWSSWSAPNTIHALSRGPE